MKLINYLVVLFILLLVLLIKYPDGIKNNDSSNKIDWSSVVENTDEHYEYSWNACQVDGYYYGLPLVSSKKHHLLGIWRKDWLEVVGFDGVPNTISEHTEVFERFKTMKPDALSFISAFGDDLDDNQKQMVLDNTHKTWGMTNDIQDHFFYFNEFFGAYDS